MHAEQITTARRILHSAWENIKGRKTGRTAPVYDPQRADISRARAGSEHHHRLSASGTTQFAGFGGERQRGDGLPSCWATRTHAKGASSGRSRLPNRDRCTAGEDRALVSPVRPPAIESASNQSAHLHAADHAAVQPIALLPEEIHHQAPCERGVELKDLRVRRSRFRVRIAGRMREAVCGGGLGSGRGGDGLARRRRSRKERRKDTGDHVEHDLSDREEVSTQAWVDSAMQPLEPFERKLGMIPEKVSLTCSLTAFLSPNTDHPPTRPAKKVSNWRSLPPASDRWTRSIVL